jgi:cell wall-associated NlpC family hydrolase
MNINKILFLLVFLCSLPTMAAERVHIRIGERLSPAQKRLVSAARQLLDEAEVSYVYGGKSIGTATDCLACNACLEKRQPAPSARVAQCPECARCSLDCSHFTQLVFRRAGIDHPYLTSKDMVSLTQLRLQKDFGFSALPPDAMQALPGDLLVYKGHVVMLERRHGQGKGDIIHATGGREIREPGQGIQRERWADLGRFRGPLLRILRHHALATPSPN